ASLVEAVAPDPAILFAARAVEGVGYLLMVIVAPTAIAAIATDRSRGRALALWSTFVPVGLALGSAVTASLVVPAGPRGVMLL
ncbi:MFS transporter, partial [Klebsiella pneumoniae]|uniref:MFS transporter n=3 Tax=Pseudomonadota TaxID=1224 RepID=UPI0013D5264A